MYGIPGAFAIRFAVELVLQAVDVESAEGVQRRVGKLTGIPCATDTGELRSCRARWPMARSNHGNHPKFVSFSFGGIMRQTQIRFGIPEFENTNRLPRLTSPQNKAGCSKQIGEYLNQASVDRHAPKKFESNGPFCG